MIKTYLNITILIVGLFATSCSGLGGKYDFGVRGNGKIVEAKRTISRFYRLIINCDADVVIEQNTSSPVITIECDKNLLKFLTTSVTKGDLEISLDEKVYHNKLKIYLNNADFNEITKNGKGNLTSLNDLKMRNIYVNTSGKGEVNLSVNTDSLILNDMGNTEVSFKGICNNFVVKTYSNEDINAKSLKTRNAIITLNSSGDCLLNSSNLMKFTINGSGDIINYTTPITLEPSINGSGEYIQR